MHLTSEKRAEALRYCNFEPSITDNEKEVAWRDYGRYTENRIADV